MPLLLALSLWWLIPGGIVAVALFFISWLFVVALTEKRPVHAYTSTPLAVLPAELPDYVGAMNEAAARLGFTPGGTYAHAKGGTYRLYQSLWMSHDRQVLATVVGGTILGIPYKNTTLFSCAGDDRYLATADEVDAGDPSGLQLMKRVLNAGFDELLAEHLRRVQAREPKGVPPFEEGTALDANMAMENALVGPTISSGSGRWTDAERTTWAYSFKGALHVSTVGLLSNTITQFAQAHRLRRRRPGAKLEQGFAVLPPTTSPPATPPEEREFLC